MKVLVDSNVILELVLQREQIDVAHQLISLLRKEKCELWMTAGGVYGLIYTIDKYLRKVMEMKNPERTMSLRLIMTYVLNLFNVAGQDKQVFLDGVKDIAFQDIEDSCQYQAALKCGCDYLVTFNVRDYLSAEGLKVLSPQELLDYLTDNIST